MMASERQLQEQEKADRWDGTARQDLHDALHAHVTYSSVQTKKTLPQAAIKKHH